MSKKKKKKKKNPSYDLFHCPIPGKLHAAIYFSFNTYLSHSILISLLAYAHAHIGAAHSFVLHNHVIPLYHSIQFLIFARAARSLLLSEAHGLLNGNRELALECF